MFYFSHLAERVIRS